MQNSDIKQNKSNNGSRATKNARFYEGLESFTYAATYAFINVFTDEIIYVGASTDIKQRIGTNLSALRAHRHSSKLLQKHFEAYGEEGLRVTVLSKIEGEEVSLTQLAELETLLLKSGLSKGNKVSKSFPGAFKNKGRDREVTDQDIAEIEQMLREGLSQAQIARIKGRAQSVVSAVKTGKYNN
jgi:hypothetical protein